ncbi:DUF423 domain-containing protein [Mesorhizobium sp. IMUNJ 23232]|uniref:DUF423 domain-containing protein n=1 Tax=Mesorhizobium sp. IMUNJ 23232 TaxID=3376064 RepID=UPI0037BAB6FF
MNADRILIFIAGLAGAAGVALSAAAAHAGGQNLQTAATFLLVHAPALLGAALLAGRTARFSGFVLAAGLALFCGDLLSRDFLGDRLFPYAAPVGGMLLIGGWLVLAASAVFDRR